MPSAQNLAALLLLALSSTIPVASAGGTYSIQQYGGGNDNSLRQVPCNGPFASIPKPTQQFNFIQPEGSGVMRDCIDYTGSDPNPPLVVHEKGYNRYLRGPAPCRDITRIQGSSFRGRTTRRCYGPKVPCAQRAQLRYCIWSAEHRMFDSAKPVSEEKPWCRDISHPHPTPMQECDCITRVTIWDKSHFRSDPDRPCRQIAQAAGITVSQILAWNPWIGDKCGEGLFAGMEPNTYEKRSVCIGVRPAAEHTEDSEAKLGDGADL